MTALAQHQSQATTRVLAIGDSGAGKTGMLASLAASGYNLRIIDLDNGVDILRSVLMDPANAQVYPPGSMDRVDVETLTDTMRNVNSRLIPGAATVWQRMTSLLMKWPEYGPVTTWTPKDVLVLDNLTQATTAALRFLQAMNNRIGQKATWDDIYGTQQMLETLFQTLFDAAIKCQIVVLAHPDFIEDQQGLKRGYPASIGNKLGPRIGAYFNNTLEIKKQKILTTSSLLEVKTSAPGRVKKEYSVRTGLAEFFKDVQGLAAG